MYIYMYSAIRLFQVTDGMCDENIGLFCKRALQKRPTFCKRDLYVFSNPLDSVGGWICEINSDCLLI